MFQIFHNFFKLFLTFNSNYFINSFIIIINFFIYMIKLIQLILLLLFLFLKLYGNIEWFL